MCSGTKIPQGEIHTLEGVTLGYDTRNSPRKQSRRQAGRRTTDKGAVKKRKPAQTGRPKATEVKDTSNAVYMRKLETARQFCATLIGDEEIRQMIEELKQNKFDVGNRLLAWQGANERLGVIFGAKYVEREDRRLDLAVAILRAHNQHLVAIEREKRRASREAATCRVHDQKASYVKKQGRRAA